LTLSEDGVFAPPGGHWLTMLVDDIPDLEIIPVLRAGPTPGEFDRGDADEVNAVGEIYLELIQLDLADAQAIFRFVQRFGLLGVAYEHFALFRSIPGLSTAVLPGLAWSWPSERFNQTREAYLERRGDGPNSTLVETLDEFRFGARVLRDLVTAVKISDLDEPPASLIWESIPEKALGVKRAELADYGIELDTRAEAVDLFLRGVLADGLRPFHPRVIYAELEAAEDVMGAPLYAVCCLELFNHLAEHANVKVCANESCRRVFVRQRGRAEHGQHRTRGIKFCSSHCARAQAQREYRRRVSRTPPAHEPPG
jgi:hypothetical protein